MPACRHMDLQSANLCMDATAIIALKLLGIAVVVCIAVMIVAVTCYAVWKLIYPDQGGDTDDEPG